MHKKYKYARLEVPVVVLKIHALFDIMLCQHGVACRRPESSKKANLLTNATGKPV